MSSSTGTMNLVMTILGFAMSATFVIFVCARLLCVRIRQRHSRSRSSLDPTTPDDQQQLERTINGLDSAVVAAFPTLKYSQGVFASKDDAVCTVCLGEYEDKEVLRLLPGCGHAFHLDCIDAWLRLHSTCPICRISLRTPDGRRAPSPLMTRAAMARFSPGALPDTLFEQQQQPPPPQWSGARRSDLPSRPPTTAPYGHHHHHLPARWRSNEAAEILWHMSRTSHQYPIDLERAMRAEEEVLRAGNGGGGGRHEDGDGVRLAGAGAADSSSSPVSGEIYFLGQRREVRYPRSGKWSVWLWRRWERGDPAASPLNQDHHELSSDWPSSSASPTAAAAAAAAPAVVVPYSPAAGFSVRDNAAYADGGSSGGAQTAGSSSPPDHLAIPVAPVASSRGVVGPVSPSEMHSGGGGGDQGEVGVTTGLIRPRTQQEIVEEMPASQGHKSLRHSSGDYRCEPTTTFTTGVCSPNAREECAAAAGKGAK